MSIKPFILMMSALWLTSCSTEPSQYAFGTVERERILLTAVTDEIITHIPISEGQEVKPGMLLLTLKDDIAKAHVQQAKANYDKAQAQYNKLKKGPRKATIDAKAALLARAKANLNLKTLAFNRAKRLKNSNLQSKATFDKAHAEYLMAKAHLNTINAELNALKEGTRIEDLEKAQAEIAMAKAQLLDSKLKLKQLYITATREGIVESLPWHLGERVTRGAPLVVLLSGKLPIARVYIPEPSRSHIKVGMVQDILIEGFAKPFKARIKKVAMGAAFTPYYTLANKEKSRLMYLAELQFIEPRAQSLPNGLPLKVKL